MDTDNVIAYRKTEKTRGNIRKDVVTRFDTSNGAEIPLPIRKNKIETGKINKVEKYWQNLLQYNQKIKAIQNMMVV